MSARFFLFIGAKGGSGATTVAQAVAQRLAGPAVIVDGDLGGSRSHAVLLDVTAELDSGRLPGATAIAKTAKLTLLELTRSYEDGFVVKPEEVEENLAQLSQAETFIVDAPQPFAKALRPFLTRAVRNIVIAEPTLLGISGARHMIARLQRFSIPPERIALVINMRDNARGMKRSEIQNLLQMPVLAELPPLSDRGYERAIRGLVADLEGVQQLEPLPDVRASAEAPTGDRRGSGPRVDRRGGGATEKTPEAKTAQEETSAAREEIKAGLHKQLMSRIDFTAAARVHEDEEKMAKLKTQVNDIVTQLVAERRDIGSVEESARLSQELVQEALGLGAIESFLHDPSITEIMVNGASNVYVERRGKLEHTPKKFANDAQVRLVIERILAPLGRRIDEASPMVDARLPDGSRVNAIIGPLAIDGPSITIRRFGTSRIGTDQLVKIGATTQSMIDFIKASVSARLNIVVSGGTGSGKTTLLNAAASFIPRDERIVTIEDAAELRLDQPHVVRLEARPANIEGRGEIKIRDLVKNSLRMRPDRIIIGECRGAEALDMLQAMNTGHDGSLTTIHANTCRDALSRVETLVMMAGFDLPVRAIREQVAAAIDIIVQVSRFSDGTRKMTSISEVVGMEGDVVTMQEIARYRQRGIDAEGKVLGAFESTGVQPACIARFAEMGIDFDITSFGDIAPVAAPVEAWAR
ncbi:MAG: hypothetical protein NVSMB5_04040 [Candidatus Velthaea sp.]